MHHSSQQHFLETSGTVHRPHCSTFGSPGIPYTDEELLATWCGSDRLLLFIQIADLNDNWNVGLKLNGQPVELQKAYSDVFPLGRERTFTGFYADASNLKPETRYEAEVSLPEGLQAGQFQGLFFENVEAVFTTDIAR